VRQGKKACRRVVADKALSRRLPSEFGNKGSIPREYRTVLEGAGSVKKQGDYWFFPSFLEESSQPSPCGSEDALRLRRTSNVLSRTKSPVLMRLTWKHRIQFQRSVESLVTLCLIRGDGPVSNM